MHKNFLQFIKYGLVGACGTLTHYTWLITLSTLYININPAYFALSGAFLGAVVNYSLNYRYTFLSAKKHVLAFPQFAALAGFNMLASSVAVQAFVNLNVHYIVGQIIASGLCVPLGFIISKKVVFSAQRY